jgi:glycine cleavage system aminomethyltransferase T
MGRVVKFDHDFIGREALEQRAQGPHRKKMTLVWDNEDIVRIYASMLSETELPFKAMDLPVSSYALGHWDQVISPETGRRIGMSAFIGYTATERKFLSPAILEPEYAVEGKRVKVVWGEPDGGSRKPQVERHRQTEIWATVAPNPYSKAVRENKNARLVSAMA